MLKKHKIFLPTEPLVLQLYMFHTYQSPHGLVAPWSIHPPNLREAWDHLPPTRIFPVLLLNLEPWEEICFNLKAFHWKEKADQWDQLPWSDLGPHTCHSLLQTSEEPCSFCDFKVGPEALLCHPGLPGNILGSHGSHLMISSRAVMLSVVSGSGGQARGSSFRACRWYKFGLNN